MKGNDAMNTIMTPSVQKNTEMTDGQIDKTADVLRAALRKHREEFNTDAAQQSLGAKGLGPDLLAVFRGYVERFSNLIVRLVRVDRARTPEQAITATGRKQYTDRSVVAAMPKGNGEEAKVVFFKPDKSSYNANGWISDDNLEKEFALRCLKPSDPYSLAAVNEADPTFADEHPNATHWKDADGKWCYAVFFHWSDVERLVRVNRHGIDWSDSWWFAGLAS